MGCVLYSVSPFRQLHADCRACARIKSSLVAVLSGKGLFTFSSLYLLCYQIKFGCCIGERTVRFFHFDSGNKSIETVKAQ